MIYTVKAKCQMCKALGLKKAEDGKPIFVCELGVPITFESYKTEGGADSVMKPRPLDKCYKPKTKAQLEKAKGLTEKRNEKSESSHIAE